jgi:uncharacterized protein (DUF924 family)
MGCADFTPYRSVSRASAQLWFGKDPKVDAFIRENFEADLLALQAERARAAEDGVDEEDDADGADEQRPFSRNRRRAAAARKEADEKREQKAAKLNPYSALVIDPEGAVAVSLLSEEFARRMYRGTARAYAFNAEASVLTLTACAQPNIEWSLDAVVRCWLYAPLVQAEDAAMQRMAHDKLALNLHAAQQVRTRAHHTAHDTVCAVGVLSLTSAVAPLNEQVYRPYLRAHLDYGDAHGAVIGRFGRFPFRNAILGRTDTADERAYIQQKWADARARAQRTTQTIAAATATATAAATTQPAAAQQTVSTAPSA